MYNIVALPLTDESAEESEEQEQKTILRTIHKLPKFIELNYYYCH